MLPKEHATTLSLLPKQTWRPHSQAVSCLVNKQVPICCDQAQRPRNTVSFQLCFVFFSFCFLRLSHTHAQLSLSLYLCRYSLSRLSLSVCLSLSLCVVRVCWGMILAFMRGSLFGQILGSGPPLGSKPHWAPLTKILDPRLIASSGRKLKQFHNRLKVSTYLPSCPMWERTKKGISESMSRDFQKRQQHVWESMRSTCIMYSLIARRPCCCWDACQRPEYPPLLFVRVLVQTTPWFLRPSSHRTQSTSQQAYANFGTHYHQWEYSHRLQATSKGLHSKLRANLLSHPVWTGP